MVSNDRAVLTGYQPCHIVDTFVVIVWVHSHVFATVLQVNGLTLNFTLSIAHEPYIPSFVGGKLSF